MLEIIKDSFRITNKYIILATPLIIFSLLSSIYVLLSTNGKLINLILSIIIFFLMFIAFISGWLYMIKESILDSHGENPTDLIKTFPEGVGEYFLPVTGMTFIAIFISVIVFLISSFAGIKIIGDPGISPEALSSALVSTDALKEFLTSLSKEQLIKINQWNLLILFTMLFTYFIMMFYPPVLYFKEKNPFKAIFIALKDLFSRKFFKSVILFLIIFFVYFIISIFSMLGGNNIFTNFIFTLINFYYFVLAIICIYNYYYKNFMKIGSNIDTVI